MYEYTHKAMSYAHSPKKLSYMLMLWAMLIYELCSCHELCPYHKLCLKYDQWPCHNRIIHPIRPCWRSSSGFGKKVNFSLALVHTINCPKAHNKTRCSGIWLHQQRPQQWSGSSLLLDWYWTQGEASWTHLGLITSSSYAKLSCWERASLNGSKMHTSSLGTSCDCAQSTSK